MIFRVQDRLAVLNADVFSLDIAKFRQPLFEDLKTLRISILRGHIAYDRQLLGNSFGNLAHR